MIFLEALPALRPSAFLPLLMAIQSSPVRKRQSSISTSSHDSGSQPSPFGPSFTIVHRRTVTFLDSTGCATQKGERNSVTSSTSTFSHSKKFTSCGLIPCPMPNLRSATGTPSSDICSSVFLFDSTSPCASLPNLSSPFQGIA